MRVFNQNKLMFKLLFLCWPAALTYGQSTTELSSVTVTATGNESFVPETLIGHHQRIEREEFTRHFTLLPDLLEQYSGISMQSIGGIGQYASPVIRGSSGHQVLVFWDGLLINSLNGGGTNLAGVSLAMADQIDIYRSSAPIELSASAVGGVIHLHTRRNESSVDTHQGEISTTQGSYGTEQYTISQRFGHSRSQWLISGDWLAADNDFRYLESQPVSNPQQPAYEPRYNNGSQQYHLLLKGRQQLAHSHLDIALQSGRSQREISGRINFSANNAALTSHDDSIQIRWQRPWSAQQQSELLASHYQRDERYDDRDGRIGLGAQLNRYATQGQRLQGNHYLQLGAVNFVTTARAQYEKTDTEFRLLSPEEAEQQCLNGRGCETAYERQQHDLGMRLQYLWQRTTLSAQLSHIRLSDRNLHRRNNHRDYHGNTWSVGISQRLLSGMSIYANGASQVRLPTTSELFGDRGTSLGNPNLLPEHAQHIEVGLQWQLGTLDIHSSLYQRHIDNAIIAESDSRGVIRFDNLGRTRHRGIEQDVRWNPIAALHLTASLTLQSNHIIEHQRIPFYEGNQAAGYSQFFSFMSVRWQQARWDASLSQTRELGGYYNNSNLLEKDPVNRWDAAVALFGQHWRISANVSDATSNAARDYPLYPEPGRMLFVRAHYQW